MQKLQRSEKAVEEYMREQRHDVMLKQELRKLKEEDLRVLRERQKRLDLRKKAEIIAKEQDNARVVKEAREREQILIKKR